MKRSGFADEGTLRTHFGRGQAVVADQSKAGAMLERARLFGQLRPHNTHYADSIQDPSEKPDRGKKQYVRVSKKYPRAPWPKVVAGVIVRSELEITAMPTAETRSAPSHEMSDDQVQALFDYGSASRRLHAMEVDQRGLTCVQALRIYYGSDGDAYASHVIDGKGVITREGVSRLVSLYPLTPEGKELLRTLRASHEANKSHMKEIEMLRSAVWFGDAELKSKLERCAVQAQELLLEAQRRWTATERGSR